MKIFSHLFSQAALALSILALIGFGAPRAHAVAGHHPFPLSEVLRDADHVAEAAEHLLQLMRTHRGHRNITHEEHEELGQLAAAARRFEHEVETHRRPDAHVIENYEDLEQHYSRLHRALANLSRINRDAASDVSAIHDHMRSLTVVFRRYAVGNSQVHEYREVYSMAKDVYDRSYRLYQELRRDHGDRGHHGNSAQITRDAYDLYRQSADYLQSLHRNSSLNQYTMSVYYDLKDDFRRLDRYASRFDRRQRDHLKRIEDLLYEIERRYDSTGHRRHRDYGYNYDHRAPDTDYGRYNRSRTLRERLSSIGGEIHVSPGY